MKKYTLAIVALAALVAFSSPLFAQDGKMMFGVKGGLNLANLSGDDVEDTSMKIGMAGGVFMCYKLTDIFAIQPELLFSMKGAEFTEDDVDGSYKVNYFEIPLLFKVNLPTEGKIKPNLYAGPALGILMSADVEVGDYSADMKDFTKSTDIGIIAGAGLGYQMEKGMLCAEVRYEVGMGTIDEPAEDVDEADVKNSVVSILVGYGFAF